MWKCLLKIKDLKLFEDVPKTFKVRTKEKKLGLKAQIIIDLHENIEFWDNTFIRQDELHKLL